MVLCPHCGRNTTVRRCIDREDGVERHRVGCTYCLEATAWLPNREAADTAWKAREIVGRVAA